MPLMNRCLLIWITLTLAACSSGSGSNAVDPQQSGLMPFQSELFDQSEFAERFSSATIFCKTGVCPEAVGGLISVFPGEGGRLALNGCSATLIAPDRVLTNAHCIPSQARQSGATCDGLVKVVFPKTSTSPLEEWQCERVEGIVGLQELELQPDWAIIKIQGRSQKKPAAIDSSGIPQNSSAQIFKVDYTLGGEAFTGAINPTQCEANNNYFLNNSYIGSRSSLFNVSGCDNEIIPGNSGSGVFDDQLHLRGLLSFRYYKDETTDRFYRSSYPDYKTNSGGGTNLHCLPGLAVSATDSHCEFDSTRFAQQARLYTQLQSIVYGENYSSVSQEILAWNSGKRPNVVRFSSSPVIETPLSTFVQDTFLKTLFVEWPTCVESSAPDRFEWEAGVRWFSLAEVTRPQLLSQRESEFRKVILVMEKKGSFYHVSDKNDALKTLLFELTHPNETDDMMSSPIPFCP